MKVLVFGRETVIQRLSALLAEEGVQTVSVSDGLGKLITQWKPGTFDMAIVDSLSEEAEAACQHINGSWAIPLMLVADMKRADWQRLRPLHPDGYLPEEAEDRELQARLRNTLCRLWPQRSIPQRSKREQQ